MSVHGTHCCTTHGCKYGDEDCPVVLGTESGIAEEWCEMCEWDANDPSVQEQKRLQEENKKLLEVLEWISNHEASAEEYRLEAKHVLHNITINALKKKITY